MEPSGGHDLANPQSPIPLHHTSPNFLYYSMSMLSTVGGLLCSEVLGDGSSDDTEYDNSECHNRLSAYVLACKCIEVQKEICEICALRFIAIVYATHVV